MSNPEDAGVSETGAQQQGGVCGIVRDAIVVLLARKSLRPPAELQSLVNSHLERVKIMLKAIEEFVSKHECGGMTLRDLAASLSALFIAPSASLAQHKARSYQPAVLAA